MEARSRGHTSPLTTNGQSPSSGSQSPIVPPSSTSTGSSSPGTPQQPLAAGSAVSPEPPPSFSPVPAPEAQQPHAPPPATASPAPPAAVPPPKRSIISRLFGTSPASDPAPPQPGGCWGAVSSVGVSLLCLHCFPCERLSRQVSEEHGPCVCARRAALSLSVSLLFLSLWFVSVLG